MHVGFDIVAALNRKLHLRVCIQGEIVYSTDSIIDELTFVVEGTLNVLVGDYPIAKKGPGQILDDALLVPQPSLPLLRPYSYVAETPAKVSLTKRTNRHTF